MERLRRETVAQLMNINKGGSHLPLQNAVSVNSLLKMF